MLKSEIMEKALENNNGYLFTSEVTKAGISKEYLSIFVEKNNLERVAQGVYISSDVWEDEMFILSLKYKNIVFSHATALMLHGLTEHEVLNYSVSVPRGYNATALRKIGCTVFTRSTEFHNLGRMSIKNNFGNVVSVYDMERTVCDIIKQKEKMDIQVFRNALKEYVKKKDKNLHRLMQYAEQLKIEKKVKEYIEVLL